MARARATSATGRRPHRHRHRVEYDGPWRALAADYDTEALKMEYKRHNNGIRTELPNSRRLRLAGTFFKTSYTLCARYSGDSAMTGSERNSQNSSRLQQAEAFYKAGYTLRATETKRYLVQQKRNDNECFETDQLRAPQLAPATRRATVARARGKRRAHRLLPRQRLPAHSLSR